MNAEDYVRKIKCLSGKQSLSRFNNAFSIDEVLRLMRGFAFKNTRKLHQENKKLIEESKKEKELLSRIFNYHISYGFGDDGSFESFADEITDLEI